MRKRKNANRIINVFDLNRLTPTNIETEKPETARQFYERLDREFADQLELAEMAETEKDDAMVAEAEKALKSVAEALHSIAGGTINKDVVVVDREGAGSGVQVLESVIDNEETAALNGRIERTSGRLQRALRELE